MRKNNHSSTVSSTKSMLMNIESVVYVTYLMCPHSHASTPTRLFLLPILSFVCLSFVTAIFLSTLLQEVCVCVCVCVRVRVCVCVFPTNTHKGKGIKTCLQPKLNRQENYFCIKRYVMRNIAKQNRNSCSWEDWRPALILRHFLFAFYST